MPAIKNVADLVKQFGPFKRINRGRETQLIQQGKHCNILTQVSFYVPYEDLPEDERPSDEELQELGETKENYMGNGCSIEVGHRLVNVDEIYESTRPMPLDLMLEGNENVWFGDDGLPSD
jgi:hypothetical protein